MAHIKKTRGWEIPESQVTPKSVYLNRRELLRSMGLASTALGTSVGVNACGLDTKNVDIAVGESPLLTPRASSLRNAFPVPLNDLYEVPERAISAQFDALSYNNYYEFIVAKEQVWQRVTNFEPEPWTLRIHGQVEQEITLGLEDIMRRFAFEERIYRHRCVERWAMTVPWSGIPLRDVLALAAPLSSATHVRFVTLDRREQQPGRDTRPNDPWPYFEGLTIEEADLDLCFLVLGMYGEPLPAQNGAPLRLAVPWKYGYKSIKAIVEIELVSEQPSTFWNTLNSREYGFYSNVDPGKPHPRWSQAEEWLIPDRENVVPTQLYNGYEEYVADLYTGDED
jgi:sulfoxide reductase catalytic subunit YedY